MRLALSLVLLVGGACDPEDGPKEADAGIRNVPLATPDGGAAPPEDAGLEPALGSDLADEACPGDLPYASELVSFDPGTGAGFGKEGLPDIVLGPPKGGSTISGSLDVVSLGIGGSIVLGFGDRQIVDGPGPDFVVFENVFYVGGNPEKPFYELGEVSVSQDGESWVSFPCATSAVDGGWPGCAGWRPRFDFDACALLPVDPAVTGGNAFDLADIGVASARYVRVVDKTGFGGPPSVGFDLDAIAAVNIE